MVSSGKIKAVAVDGPAGSGKSTVSRLLASRLGFTYIDTGAMYRAITLKVMRNGISLSDEERMAELSAKLDLELLPSEKEGTTIKVVLDGEDVSEAIRTLNVTVNVKHVARIPDVRKNLVKLQRAFVRRYDGSVMEGRDIGTIVLPDAKWKIFLDATFDKRVERRYSELLAKGIPASRQDVEDDVKVRDHSDRTRKVGPLKKADDAHLIDTTDLSVDEVVERILGIIRKNP